MRGLQKQWQTSGAKVLESHLPCPCGKSSDAFTIYDDGHGYCFSAICSKPHYKSVDTPEKEPYNRRVEERSAEPLESATYQFTPIRGLTEETVRKYNIATKYVGEQPVSVGFKYPTFVKVRQLDNKQFFISGNRTEGLFGKELFPKGTFDTIVLTEGEFDAPSVYQELGYPSVSVQSASFAVKDVRADFEYVNSARRIFLAFDSDDPGQRAAKAVAGMFPFDKVFVVDFGELKDANAFITQGRVPALKKAFGNARKYVPDGVVSTYSDIEEILKGEKVKPFCSVPFKELEDKMEGFRLGTSILVSGLEGIGKTEIVRKFEHHILKETEFNIGVIHLEESQEACIKNLLSYELEVPLKRRNVEIPTEELIKHYKSLTRRDNRVFVYSHFGSSDPDDFLQIVRFLVQVCDCKVVFFDHINILVSGLSTGQDERRLLDYTCSRLAMMVEELNFCLVFVCHENNEGGTRGSMNMSQTAHVRIRLNRDKEHPNPVERNKLHLVLSKNRPTGPTGPCGYGWYNENTGVLEDGWIRENDKLLGILPEIGDEG